jgi:hypothetical protein
MKGIFSIAAFVALASALVSSAPLTRRTIPTGTFVPASYYEVIQAQYPDAQETTQSPTISVIDGSNEVDSFVSFTLPAGILTSTSTCQFFLQGVGLTATPNAAVQLFSLGSALLGTETWNSHPSYNQDEGQYIVDSTTGDSTPLYGGYVPCADTMEFVIRPHFTDATLQWTQTDTVGAFIVVN